MTEKPYLPVITGPTASGKTACTVEFCLLADGEVISADSMQVYRDMEILTAMPSEEEMRGVPHHMMGVFSPIERCNAVEYRNRANAAIAEVLSRGKQPVICGGTGLYIDAITKPLRFSEKSDDGLHAELMLLSREPGGKRRLHEMLEQVDPESAARLHENDVRRVVRAIEIYKLTGRTQSEQAHEDEQREGDYQESIYALEWPRDELYARISRRVDEMVARGMVSEVRQLMERYYESPTAVQAIGFKEIAMALRVRITLDQAIDEVKQATRNYARRQITWLKRDARTVWIPASKRTPQDLASEIYDKWRAELKEKAGAK